MRYSRAGKWPLPSVDVAQQARRLALPESGASPTPCLDRALPYTTDALDLLLAIRNGQADARWNHPLELGSTARVTYSFAGLTEPMKEAVRSILASIEDSTKLDFKEVTGTAQMEFDTDFRSTMISMWSSPRWTDTGMDGGDVTLMAGTSWTEAALQPGGQDYLFLMDAVLGALGLRRPQFPRADGTELHPSLNTQLHTIPTR